MQEIQRLTTRERPRQQVRKYRALIQVAEQRDAGGLVLTYILQSKPRLTDIKFSGNKKYKHHGHDHSHNVFHFFSNPKEA
jgi:hypothetical protein